jgi:tetratricopeptide (TPR) repeat protein
MKKRLCLLSVLFAIMGGGAYFLLRPNPQKRFNQALSHVARREYVKAHDLLTQQPRPIYTSLYRGYLEQMRSRFELAERYFQMAFQDAHHTHHTQAASEIVLAQAANSFYKGDDVAFASFLETARALNPDAPTLLFFEGLGYYIQGNYTEALRFWTTAECAVSPSPLSAWQDAAFNILFPVVWRQLHTAHCLIEQGDLVSARVMIEKQNRLVSSDQELLPLGTLLLGLSYLKEAHQVPIDQRSSYYQFARFYFERTPLNGRLCKEREVMISHIEHEAEHTLLSTEQRNSGFALIHILQDWKAAPSIERLAAATTMALLNDQKETSVGLCSVLREEFQGSPFHLIVAEKVLSALTQQVKAGEADNLFNVWALVEHLAPSPHMAAKQLAALTADEIFETIRKDTPTLSRTRNFLAFWEKLGRTPLEKEVMAYDLLGIAKMFWHFEAQEMKGQQLMQAALDLSEHHPSIMQEISAFLTLLFKQAESCNMVGRLMIVYEAMGEFDISRHELVSRSTLANHIADAQYLYRTHNYIAAKSHAGWALKLDPCNTQARRLVGLSAFQLGEYHQALTHLQLVETPDEDTSHALTLSQTFANQIQTQHLCLTKPSGVFEPQQ